MSSLPLYVTDAYGAEAKSLLRPLQDDFSSLAYKVTDYFYDYILTQEHAAVVINRLRPETFKRLKRHVVLYLRTILSHELTHPTHVYEAQKAGRTHALEGIEIRWLMEAYGFYQEEILKLLRGCISDSETRESLMRVISQRFLQDIEIQASSYKQLATEVSQAFSRADQEVMSTGNPMDLIRGTLQILGTLPGGVSVFFARMDDAGVLQIEHSYGNEAERYHNAMEAGIAPKISVDPSIPEGQGPGGRAWRNGEITVSDAWLIEPDKKPWQQTGEDLGFRSSAAVPLLDELGNSIALLSLYSKWPGYFSNESIRGFLDYFQQLLNREIQLRTHLPVVPLREQQFYRRLLAEHRVVIRYQPVIDLCDGSLVKIEGFTHLCGEDGELISPQRFLPALDGDELLMFFELGLWKISADFPRLQAYGLDTMIAFSLPTEGLGDRRYEQIIYECLAANDLKPDLVQVKVLESHNAGEEKASHKAFIERLQAAGLQIAQDDLGSVNGSLLRLGQYSFDEVKIGSRVLGGYDPQNIKHALDFILHLTRLSHAFDTPITIEGLENQGMVEAAAILGADCGQGPGIAEPMSLDQLPIWHRKFTYKTNPRKPRTGLGILACYMLWDIELEAYSKQSKPTTEFIEAKLMVVEHFVIVNNLKRSPLEQSLTSYIKMAASSGRFSEAAVTMQAQLIKELTSLMG